MANISMFIFLLWVCSASAAVRLQELYSWNVLDWNFPDEYSRQLALKNGAVVPENALPVGIERWKNKLFVTVPRWKAGIPATLNYIPLDAPYEPSPKLTPYPSLAGNELGNCDSGLNTVYRIKADRCDRLWVLDVGTYGYDPNVTNVCPYTLNVYDLKTDRRIRKYVFRPEDIVPTTFIANIALDMGSSCEDTYAYFSDELGYGLIAYSWQKNKSWRFDHSFFLPDPLQGDYNIAGLNFQWYTEGIFGISASPIGDDGFRNLYFSPLASSTEFSVSTKILRDETKVKGSFKDFKEVGSRGPNGHTTSKVIDESGVQLFNLVDQNAIGCWSSSLSYNPQNIALVDKDDIGLIFPTDIKIDNDKNVWVISDRMPVFLESTLDYSDINFRIYTAPLSKLIEGTVCDPANSFLQPTQPIFDLGVTNPTSNFKIPAPPKQFNSNNYNLPTSRPSPNINYNQVENVRAFKPPTVDQFNPNIFTLPTSRPSLNPNNNQQSIESVRGFYNRNIGNNVPRVSSVINFPPPTSSIPYYVNKGPNYYYTRVGNPEKQINLYDWPGISTPIPYIPKSGTDTVVEGRRLSWNNQLYEVKEQTL